MQLRKQVIFLSGLSLFSARQQVNEFAVKEIVEVFVLRKESVREQYISPIRFAKFDLFLFFKHHLIQQAWRSEQFLLKDVACD